MSTTDSEVRLQLRPLGPGDLPRIMEIERVSFSVPWQRNTFDSLFRRNDTDLVGAERDAALVGYAVCWTILDEAELGNVAVAPEARACGVADTLVRAVPERAFWRCASPIWQLSDCIGAAASRLWAAVAPITRARWKTRWSCGSSSGSCLDNAPRRSVALRRQPIRRLLQEELCPAP